MQTSRVPAPRLPASGLLALVAAIGLLLGASSSATVAHLAARGPSLGQGFGTSAVHQVSSLPSSVTASVRSFGTAPVSIGSQPRSHGAPVPRLQRAVLLRQIGLRVGPTLGITAGAALMPTAALLELDRLAGPAARGVLGWVGRGRGPPWQTGT